MLIQENKMLQELDLQTITVTTAAAQAVNKILGERKLEGYALRVYVAQGGCCSGVNFGMALDNNIRDEDRTFEAEGVKMVVDPISADYLQGATIDFMNDPQRGSGFVIDSPSARESGHPHEEGGCACGGSCSCNN
jgi:iron-sulfur cluster assembly accessory protein